jgi:hypothetical protein
MSRDDSDDLSRTAGRSWMPVPEDPDGENLEKPMSSSEL